MPRRAKKLNDKPDTKSSTSLDEMVRLPATIVKKARERLAERGLGLEEYVAFCLRLMLKNKTTLRLDDDMPFGKYAGEKVGTICRADPTYIIWLVNEKGKTRFDPEVIALVGRIAEEES